MSRNLTFEDLEEIIEEIRKSKDPKVLSDLTFGTQYKDSLIAKLIEELDFFEQREKRIIETSRIIKEKIQRDQEIEIIRLFREILEELKIQSEGFKKMQFIQQDQITFSAVTEMQKFVRDTINDFPAILEIYIEELYPGGLLIYFIIPDKLPYHLYKPVARYQSVLYEPFKEIIHDFRVIRQTNRYSIVNRKLVKIT